MISFHQCMQLLVISRGPQPLLQQRPSVICRLPKLAFLLPLLLKGFLLLGLAMKTLNLCRLSVKQAQAELSKLTIPARGAASTTRAVGMPASATCRTLTVIVAESQLHQAEVSLLIW